MSPPGCRREHRALCHAGAQKRPLLSSGRSFLAKELHGSGHQALLCSPWGQPGRLRVHGEHPWEVSEAGRAGGLDGARELSQEWVFPLPFCYTTKPGQRRLLDPESGKCEVAPCPLLLFFGPGKGKMCRKG